MLTGIYSPFPCSQQQINKFKQASKDNKRHEVLFNYDSTTTLLLHGMHARTTPKQPIRTHHRPTQSRGRPILQIRQRPQAQDANITKPANNLAVRLAPRSAPTHVLALRHLQTTVGYFRGTPLLGNSGRWYMEHTIFSTNTQTGFERQPASPPTITIITIAITSATTTTAIRPPIRPAGVPPPLRCTQPDAEDLDPGTPKKQLPARCVTLGAEK